MTISVRQPKLKFCQDLNFVRTCCTASHQHTRTQHAHCQLCCNRMIQLALSLPVHVDGLRMARPIQKRLDGQPRSARGLRVHCGRAARRGAEAVACAHASAIDSSRPRAGPRRIRPDPPQLRWRRHRRPVLNSTSAAVGGAVGNRSMR